MLGRKSPAPNGANVGYENKLRQMANALGGSMDAVDYRHVVIGLLFLKQIFDAFEERHAKLKAERKNGPDELPWPHLKIQAKLSTIAHIALGDSVRCECLPACTLLIPTFAFGSPL